MGPAHRLIELHEIVGRPEKYICLQKVVRKIKSEQIWARSAGRGQTAQSSSFPGMSLRGLNRGDDSVHQVQDKSCNSNRCKHDEVCKKRSLRRKTTVVRRIQTIEKGEAE